METLLTRLQQQLGQKGLTDRSLLARKWLLSIIPTLRPNRLALLKDRSRLRTVSMKGRLYLFHYLPKGKDELPYYDAFPLVIPIERYGDGFLGLNLHYLSPKIRFIMLNKLSTLVNNHRYDETTRLRVSYPILQHLSRLYEHTPCLKRYLASHIRSRFLEIEPSQWDIAVALPLAQFRGDIPTNIWKESTQIMQERNPHRRTGKP